MYDIKKIFAHNIKRLRKNRNLTQEQFAERIGVQWKTVANFESARNIASCENLENICNKLDISPAELFLLKAENTNDTKQKIDLILNRVDEEKLKTIYGLILLLNNEIDFEE